MKMRPTPLRTRFCPKCKTVREMHFHEETWERYGTTVGTMVYTCKVCGDEITVKW